jgi:hypothetical protein
MDLALLVYGISLLDGLDKLFVGITMISVMVAAASGIYTLSHKFDSYEYSWNCNKDGTVKQSVLENRAGGVKLLKWSIIVFLVAAIIQIFIPSQKTAYTMVGAYAAQKVAQNEKLQDTGGKVMTIINQKLDKYIDEGIEAATNEVKSKRNKSKD